MKKIVASFALLASASMTHAFTLAPNGDFSTPGGANWNSNGSGGTVISFETTGGNGGGYGKIDNTGGAWGGVLVAEGGAGAHPAGGNGVPLAALNLVAGNSFTFSLDMIGLGPLSGAMAGIKIENWTDVGVINDTGDLFFTTTNSWATYTTAPFLIAPTATRVKLVPLLVGPKTAIGFDNVGANAVPEPTGAMLLGLGAMGMLVRRRR